MIRNRYFSMRLAVVALAFPGCGNTPTGLPGPGGATLSSTVLDSDGDGFSDDTEINGIPGTDPFDPTDNPNNVRDSDDDGCSNYDELNFDGFCDGDPDTPVSVACDTGYYNSDFRFGFDLPGLAILQQFNEQQDFLFSAGWFFGSDIAFFTAVQDLPESTAPFDEDALAMRIERARAGLAGTGQDIIVDTGITLANGDLGHILVATFQGILATYQVFTVKHNMSFNVSASVGLPVSESDDTLLTEIVLSLCAD